jgi:hypothetical protein
VNFFKKIEGIGYGVVKRTAGFAKNSSRAVEKYPKQGGQLLLDKVGELIYLHKIFQHISAGGCRDTAIAQKTCQAVKS